MTQLTEQLDIIEMHLVRALNASKKITDIIDGLDRESIKAQLRMGDQMEMLVMSSRLLEISARVTELAEIIEDEGDEDD